MQTRGNTFAEARRFLLIVVQAMFLSFVWIIGCSENRNVTPLSPPDNKDQADTCESIRTAMMAIVFYHESHNRYPPRIIKSESSVDLYSWRLAIQPFFDPLNPSESILWYRKKAWNSDENQGFLRSKYGRGMKDADGFANVFAVYSKNSDSDEVVVDASFPPERGTDSDVIILISVQQNTTHWMQPGDMSAEYLQQIPPATSVSDVKELRGTVCIAFRDRQIFKISGETPVGLLAQYSVLGQNRNRDRDFQDYLLTKE